MSRGLEGKVAIVTGAGTGIGEAIALRARFGYAHKFAKLGAKVVVNGLPSDPVAQVAEALEQYGGEAIALRARFGFAHLGDISEESLAQACIQTAIDDLTSCLNLTIAAQIELSYATTATRGFLATSLNAISRASCYN